MLVDSDIEYSSTGRLPSGSLDKSGSIYVLSKSNKNLSMLFKNDQIGLLVARGSMLGEIYASQNKFLWIEGHIGGESLSTDAIRFKEVSHSVISNCKLELVTLLHEFYPSGSISLQDSDYNLIRGCTISENNRGIIFYRSNFNHLKDIKLYNNLVGIQLLSSSNNLISGVSADGHGYTGSFDRNRYPADGLLINSWYGIPSIQNIVHNSRFSNSGVPGKMEGGVNISESSESVVTGLISHGNTFGIKSGISVLSNITTVNNTGIGLQLMGGNSVVSRAALIHELETGLSIAAGDASVFSDIASLYSVTAIKLANTNGKFTGVLVKQQYLSPSNLYSCVALVATDLPGLIDTTCTESGVDGSNRYGNNSSDATLRIVSNGSPFVGKVYSDRVNTTGGSDRKTLTLHTDITDWSNFENLFRSWGLDGSAPLWSSDRGPCYYNLQFVVNCVIWDWSLLANDNKLRNIVVSAPKGDNYFSFNWGSEVIQFLNHASERMDDGIGNDNTLCESNEHCIFNPNIGAYQGHGPLVLKQASEQFVDGVISNVTMWEYEFNGVE